jgi:hypothetical protein
MHYEQNVVAYEVVHGLTKVTLDGIMFLRGSILRLTKVQSFFVKRWFVSSPFRMQSRSQKIRHKAPDAAKEKVD